MVTAAKLNQYLSLHIRDICPVGFRSDRDNHCAHFVSHVLGLSFGATCRTMVSGSGPAASIRVQEIFGRCWDVGAWSNLPSPLLAGLVFITNAANVNLETKRMNNVPRKHVGIFFGGSREIWHYSNRRCQVVRQTPTAFSAHYAAPDNAMFWGSVS